MSSLFARPIRNRIGLTPGEKRAAAGKALVQYRLGSAMVILNLIVPFNRETFGGYFLPAIVMFTLACVISNLRRILWPQNSRQAGLLSGAIIVACLYLWFYGRDLSFSQRLLGSWQVTNIFARFTIVHMLGVAIAACLIPHTDSWYALHVTEFLVGASLVGVGIPEEELVSHTFYLRYLAVLSVLTTSWVNSDVARCFRTFSASSPLTNLEGSKKILRMWVLGSIFEPLRTPLGYFPRCLGATLRAEILWLSMWPTPPESLDPRNVRLGHSILLRRPGMRRFAAALAYAALFAVALVANPPATSTRPYLVFALEIVSPPVVQFLALALVYGPFLVRADRLSQTF